MGKASAPAAPDYSGIASADETAANNQFQLGQQQLSWAQNQFNTVWPYAQQYLDQQTASSAAETQNAQNAQDYYEKTYQPIETDFANQAKNYNSPQQAEENASGAMADVASAFDAQRANSLSTLESYGIDPSQTRFGALDLGTRISQAAATAGAATQSRVNTQLTGLNLEGQAINVGRGYPSAVAQAYSTATGAGSAGIGAANQTTGTGSNTMTGSTAFTSAGLSANAGAAGALNTGFENNLAGSQFNAQQSQGFWGGVGQLAGTAMMAGALAF